METTYRLKEEDGKIIFETNSAEINEAITAYIQMTIKSVIWQENRREPIVYGRKFVTFSFDGSKDDGENYKIVFETNAPEWLKEIKRYIEHYIYSYNYQHMVHDMSRFETV